MPPPPPRPCHVWVDSGKPEARGTVAEPRQSYDYNLENPAGIATIVKDGAGVGKIGPSPHDH